jgi:hypothetical protein
MDTLQRVHDSTAEHFLYFWLGFAMASILFLVLFVGYVLGNYRKRKSVRDPD